MRTCNSDNGDWFLLSELCAILDSLYAIYCVLFEPYKVRDRLKNITFGLPKVCFGAKNFAKADNFDKVCLVEIWFWQH